MKHDGDDMKHDWKHWIPVVGFYFFSKDMNKENHIIGKNYIILHAAYTAIQITILAIAIS